MTFTDACTLLAPYVDNGVNANAKDRIASRVNEAQRRLIDQYNFLCRREELEQAAITYSARPVDSLSSLLIDSVDATKVMLLSLWREENNELEQAQSLESRSLAMLERDLVQTVETARRKIYQELETGTAGTAGKAYNSLGGLTGRLGLEVVPRYKIAPNRLRSYIRSSYRMAVDHYNYIVRRETFSLPTISSNVLTDDDSVLEISPEVIRELVLSQLQQDNA